MELEVNSIDQVLMVERYLENNHKITLRRHFRHTDDFIMSKEELINEIINTSRNPESTITEINKYIKSNLLPREYIAQNFESHRFVNFCWSYLCCALSKPEITNRFVEVKSLQSNRKSVNFIYQAPFIRGDQGIVQRKSSLLESIQHANSDIEKKKNFVEKLKYLWACTDWKDMSFSWLDANNNNHIEWAYNYLLEYTKIETPFNPYCPEDMYWAFIAAFDLETNTTTAELSMLKLKKSFSQMKYREKKQRNEIL